MFQLSNRRIKSKSSQLSKEIIVLNSQLVLTMSITMNYDMSERCNLTSFQSCNHNRNQLLQFLEVIVK